MGMIHKQKDFKRTTYTQTICNLVEDWNDTYYHLSEVNLYVFFQKQFWSLRLVSLL
jgi:hypothetical protein